MTDLARRGIRSLAVARTNDDGKWQMLGILTFLDPPRPDTKITLERAMEAGVDVKVRGQIQREMDRAKGSALSVPIASLGKGDAAYMLCREQTNVSGQHHYPNPTKQAPKPP